MIRHVLVSLSMALVIPQVLLAQETEEIVRRYRSARTPELILQHLQVAQELERLVEQRRFEEARNLMQLLLERKQAAYEKKAHEEDPINGLNDIEVFAKNIPPLLDRSNDDLYKMHEADVRADLAAQRYATLYREEHSDPAAQEAALQELTAIVERQFEIKLGIREAEVKELENRLSKVRAQLERRKQLAKEIINRRVNELTGKPDELSWDESASSKESLNIRTVVGRPVQYEHLITPGTSVIERRPITAPPGR